MGTVTPYRDPPPEVARAREASTRTKLAATLLRAELHRLRDPKWRALTRSTAEAFDELADVIDALLRIVP